MVQSGAILVQQFDYFPTQHSDVICYFFCKWKSVTPVSDCHKVYLLVIFLVSACLYQFVELSVACDV